MKRVKLWFLVVAFAVTVTLGTGRSAFADLVTPISNWSLDGSNYLLYKTANSLFGLSLTSNAQLSSAYGMNNPGTIQATNGVQVFAVSGTYRDNSIFTFTNATTGSTLANNNTLSYIAGSNVGNLSTSFVQNFLNRRMWNGSSFVGGFNYSFTNGNPDNGGTWYSNVYEGSQQVNHFAYFDVTALAQQYYSNLGFDYTTAYLVGYEDRGYYNQTDWDGDYQDLVFLIFMNNPADPPPIDPPPVDPPPGGGGDVPEPATMLLWTLGGFGMAGTSWIRKRRMMKKFAFA
jgi:hypothetical protein